MINMEQGVFIAIEGLDGAGGETLLRNIVKECNQGGIPCLQQKYPDYTSPWGKIIRTYLKGKIKIDPTILFLTNASDQLKDQNKIRNFIQKGGIVVCDRYITSAIAYESALGMPYPMALKLTETLKFEKPDLVVYLDVSPEVSGSRKQQEKGSLDIHEANSDLLTQVRKVYKEMSSTNILGKWITIDATMTPEEISNQVWDAIIEKRSEINQVDT